LRWSGNNPSLIQRILKDAQLLELLKANLKKQVQSLVSFHKSYGSDEWRALHEQSSYQLQEFMKRFGDDIDDMKKECDEQLAALSESSQNIIQLVIMFPWRSQLQILTTSSGIQLDIHCRSAEINIYQPKHETTELDYGLFRSCCTKP
jgi:hypothetical protein